MKTKWLALLPLLFLLAGCQTPLGARAGMVDLTYDHLGAISFDVAHVEVVDVWSSPMTSPNVEHLFPTRPAQAIHRWARDRIDPVGESGVLRVIIREASVVEDRDVRDWSDWRGWLDPTRPVRYDGLLAVDIVVDKPSRAWSGKAEVVATRRIHLPADISPVERDRRWVAMLERMMWDLNKGIEEAIDTYLKDVVATP
ncbi:MAG: hypothetical protein U9N14_04060 [Pseudomonadota bacterium]|nr:hypothetical protein [Pseudomonadota bacterium]